MGNNMLYRIIRQPSGYAIYRGDVRVCYVAYYTDEEKLLVDEMLERANKASME